MTKSNLAYDFKSLVDSLKEQQILGLSIATESSEIIRLYEWFDALEKSKVNEEQEACKLAKQILFRTAISRVLLTDWVLKTSEVSGLGLSSILPDSTKVEKIVPVLNIVDGQPVATANVKSIEVEATSADPNERPAQLFNKADMKKDILDRITKGETADSLYHEYRNLLKDGKYLLNEDEVKKKKQTFNWKDKQIKDWFFSFVKPVFEPTAIVEVKSVMPKKATTDVTTATAPEEIIPEGKVFEQPLKVNEFAMMYKGNCAVDINKAKVDLQEFFKGSKYTDEVIAIWADAVVDAKLETKSPFELLETINERMSDVEDSILSLKDIKDLILDEVKPENLAISKLTVQDSYNDYWKLLSEGKYSSKDPKHAVHHWTKEEFNNWFIKIVPEFKPVEIIIPAEEKSTKVETKPIIPDAKADAENQGGKTSENVSPFPIADIKTPGDMVIWLGEKIRTEAKTIKDPKTWKPTMFGSKLKEELEKAGHKVALKNIHTELKTVLLREFPEIYKSAFVSNEDNKKLITPANVTTAKIADTKIATAKVETTKVATVNTEPIVATTIVEPVKTETEEELVVRMATVKRPDYIKEADDLEYKKFRTLDDLNYLIDGFVKDPEMKDPYIIGAVNYILAKLNNIGDFKNPDSTMIAHFLKKNYNIPKEAVKVTDAKVPDTKPVEEKTVDTKIETVKTETTKAVTVKPTTAKVEAEANTDRTYSVIEKFNMVEAITDLQTANVEKQFTKAVRHILNNIPTKEQHKEYMSSMFNALQDKAKTTGIYAIKMASNKPEDVYAKFNKVNDEIIRMQSKNTK